MFKLLQAIFETAFGLLVDDGSLAVGIVVALGIVWIAVPTIGDSAGWLLLILLTVLLLGNLYVAGGSARRKVASEKTGDRVIERVAP